ncbi:MAG: ATP-binding protein [Bdellovibrionaceae bacterium]|nr:ATP-binding protein [Pseudobdellovibrionaceae bacterium]
MDFFWKKSGWDREDKHLFALNHGPFKRKYPDINLTPGVTLIRGPRQIGKSTWMKTLLKKHSQQGESCFFYSCEDLNDHKDLTALLDSQPEVEYFFLDEVTFVKEWWRSIKKSTDASLNKKYILTGSNSYDLKFGLDLMPGRWAQGGGEMFLLPMDFEEWCEMRRQAQWPTLSRVDGLRLYMKTGGFPTALTESGPEGKHPVNAIKTYRRWIEGDVVKLRRQPQYMMELIGQIAKSLGSSLSLQTLAKNTQMMSYHTAQDYIGILEHAFAVRVLYAYNPEKDSFHMKKDKKFYFTDPLIFWVALEWSGIKTPENFESQLAENIACEHLMRKTKRMGYYSDQNGEVDFISAKDWAIEVKWAPTAGNLSKAFKNLAIANKKVWTQSNLLL